jgi:NADH-quinone oxidoreductase subunit N
VISAYYYLRVVAAMYMRDAQPAEAAAEAALISPGLQVGVGLSAVAVVLLGLYPAPILDLARVTVAALVGG